MIDRLKKLGDWFLYKVKNDPSAVLIVFLFVMVILVAAISDDGGASRKRLREKQADLRQQKAEDMLRAAVNFAFEIRKIDTGYEVKIKELEHEQTIQTD